MFNIILFEPEIPPNTGNVIRLCANTGAQLHLIRPLGFELEDKQLRRAGLDYHEYARMQVHDNIEECLKSLPDSRLFALSTKGTGAFHKTAFKSGDAFLFGPESRGLPAAILSTLPSQHILRLPMLPNNRSLNLSNTVAVTVYEAWRQIGFLGSE
jgi:tRNA (cytidine/uridine-2'-O-)-methyltransferase